MQSAQSYRPHSHFTEPETLAPVCPARDPKSSWLTPPHTLCFSASAATSCCSAQSSAQACLHTHGHSHTCSSLRTRRASICGAPKHMPALHAPLQRLQREKWLQIPPSLAAPGSKLQLARLAPHPWSCSHRSVYQQLRMPAKCSRKLRTHSPETAFDPLHRSTAVPANWQPIQAPRRSGCACGAT